MSAFLRVLAIVEFCVGVWHGYFDRHDRAAYCAAAAAFLMAASIRAKQDRP